MANALNLHPDIMCGDEYFPSVELACAAAMPAAFEDTSYQMPNSERTRTLFRSKKSDARIFGNKDPRYFFRLPHINRAAPLCKKICVYRPRLGFWNSWDARARNHDDIYWGRGQNGFFGVLELICLLGLVADIEASGEVLLVNYNDLFFEDPNTINTIYEYLGAAPNPAAISSFQQSHFAPANVVRNPPNEEAENVYGCLQLAWLERTMFTRPAVTNFEVADILKEYCRSCRPLVGELIDSRFPNMPMRELAYFLNAKELRNTLFHLNILTRTQRALDGDQKSVDRIGPDLIRLQRRFDELTVI